MIFSKKFINQIDPVIILALVVAVLIFADLAVGGTQW